MNNGWQVVINDNYISREKNVFIFTRRSDGSDDMLNMSKGSHVAEIVNVKAGEGCIPTMVLREDMLQALFDEMSKKGMKSPEKSFIEGKLDAVERHLEDMRTMVFKNK